MSATSFFGGAFFGGEFFNTPAPPAPVTTEEQASNWQAHYWKQPWKTQEERQAATLAERIALGILPDDISVQTLANIVEAANASASLAAGQAEGINALAVAMQARAEYERLYREAYKEHYVESLVSEYWRQDMERETRRRKAILLLLH